MRRRRVCRSASSMPAHSVICPPRSVPPPVGFSCARINTRLLDRAEDPTPPALAAIASALTPPPPWRTASGRPRLTDQHRGITQQPRWPLRQRQRTPVRAPRVMFMAPRRDEALVASSARSSRTRLGRESDSGPEQARGGQSSAPPRARLVWHAACGGIDRREQLHGLQGPRRLPKRQRNRGSPWQEVPDRSWSG